MYRTRIGGALDPKYFLVCLTGTILDFVYLVYNDAYAAWAPLLIMVHFNALFFMSMSIVNQALMIAF